MSLEIEVSREGHVGLIEMQRPPHNYFTIKLIREIGDALDALDVDKDVRAVVLAAQGSSFCAGADLKENGDFGGADVSSRFGALYEAGCALLRTGQPSIMRRIPAPADPARDTRGHIVNELGPTSFMRVPMLARGMAIGVLTFVSAQSRRE